ncbi:hypothetical protein CDAR_106211 [Caerostris darwini]|uniref:Uncharacterized protein n=1 Tax=Caerostris darwini TaxID=1538125 RepID=A0AAV4SIG0_9ARAC|nr:hypothetical protein CDAR_106211 [Caerostris darwini]
MHSVENGDIMETCFFSKQSVFQVFHLYRSASRGAVAFAADTSPNKRQPGNGSLLHSIRMKQNGTNSNETMHGVENGEIMERRFFSKQSMFQVFHFCRSLSRRAVAFAAVPKKRQPGNGSLSE